MRSGERAADAGHAPVENVQPHSANAQSVSSSQEPTSAPTSAPLSYRRVLSDDAAERWRTVRQYFRSGKAQREKRSVFDHRELNIERELETGMLETAMLKLNFERDEDGHKHVPVLLQHVRFRIAHTLYSGHSGSFYRIELEYGPAKHMQWVIYRDLRDFVTLHTSMRAHAVKGYLGNPLHHEDSLLPSFPKNMLAQLMTLRKSEKADSPNDRAEREALENYLVALIRACMFRPQANKLCRFLEISAMALHLGPLPGILGKQGYVKIRSKSSHKTRFSIERMARGRAPKWAIVRESYIILLEQIDSMLVYDVFLMDQDFKVTHKHRYLPNATGKKLDTSPQDEKNTKSELDAEDVSAAYNTIIEHDQVRPSHYVKRHTFFLQNSERRLRVVARSERDMDQFLASIRFCASRNVFGRPNRFDSFAPIRRNVMAQWHVDGRDYYWSLSEAISLARHHIYIHDWWLSPEFYFRRPGQPEWRLDNLLKRKAEQGVRIYVIVYNEVSNNFTPTDSSYAKTRLMGLHPNIFVQRSPSHFQTGTFYWAHHEKMCMIDDMVGFMGGFDLCFGRWDTPGHVLTDEAHGDDLTSDANFLGPVRNEAEALVWPGQDYANERIVEWSNLTCPEADILDRAKQPRMPWHDTGAQLFGQPARDLGRHFCQRWNMLLRTKAHTRRMPFLIPSPDFRPSELKELGIRGTCDVQICRSAGPWSLGTAHRVEHSIQNAYLKAIQTSDHFVYIENQFFITSTSMDGIEIENKIGMALVDRIIRAHQEGTPWRAIIVIPLTPGFPQSYDHSDSGSVRIIVTLQGLTISHGPNSIFSRLLRAGITPSDYIHFFSLRTWGRLKSGQLVTEQIYPHDKIMIVDDRLAIIGSANINERSQRGDRDSELACVVQDTDMLESTMGGKPYRVGRFAHTLRLRLMREHAGINVDRLEENTINKTADESQEEIPSPLSVPQTPEAGHSRTRSRSRSALPPQVGKLDANAFIDPVAPEFYEDVWLRIADYNTAVFRQVFRCVPDDEVTTWKAYKQVSAWMERHANTRHENATPDAASGVNSTPGGADDPARTSTATPFTPAEVTQMIAQLQTCKGSLVHYATRFLEQESAANNFMFAKDRINPLTVFD
ncbi:phospholipase D [Malassezia cuniculi]|uniref:Phospholipase n=1 Tax=Malassezia cuniculi TaxID=948313 RepID=A0AAF0ENP8_9BASI|nr:phospholipase D [Malassezia cuniculi]